MSDYDSQGDGGQDGGDGGAQGAAAFAFDQNGLLVSPDDTDNPDGHVVLHHDAGTKVSFSVWNMGNAEGTATVTVYVDDQQVTTWTSGTIAAGSNEAPEVHGIGRYATGSHVFRVIVQPGQSGGDDTTNTVDIE